MSSGILGAISITSADTWTTIYTVPANTLASCALTIVNKNKNNSAIIDIGVTASATPGNAEYLESGFTLPQGGTFKLSQLVLGAGKKIMVRSTLGTDGNVNAVAMGYEEQV